MSFKILVKFQIKSYKENHYQKFREIVPRYGVTRAGYSEGMFFNNVMKTIKKRLKTMN